MSVELKVGMRVKVVDDKMFPKYNGAYGTIVEIDESRLPYTVRFDEPFDQLTEDGFSADEIAPVNVTVIEGVAGVTSDYCPLIDDEYLLTTWAGLQGKRVRVTIEVLDDEH